MGKYHGNLGDTRFNIPRVGSIKAFNHQVVFFLFSIKSHHSLGNNLSILSMDRSFLKPCHQLCTDLH